MSRTTFTSREHPGMYEHLPSSFHLIYSSSDTLNLFSPHSQLPPPPGLIAAKNQPQIPNPNPGQGRDYDVEKEVYSWRTREHLNPRVKTFAMNIRKKRYRAGAMIFAFFLAVAVGAGVGVTLNGKKSNRSSPTAAAAISNPSRCVS